MAAAGAVSNRSGGQRKDAKIGEMRAAFSIVPSLALRKSPIPAPLAVACKHEFRLVDRHTAKCQRAAQQLRTVDLRIDPSDRQKGLCRSVGIACNRQRAQTQRNCRSPRDFKNSN
jgi:hypothetical protein